MFVKLRKRDSVFPEMNMWMVGLYLGLGKSATGLINSTITKEDAQNPEKIIEVINNLIEQYETRA